MRLHLSAVVLAVAAAAAGADDAIAPAELGPRTVRLTYEALVTPPEGTHVLELWLPLPREDDQAVLELRLSGTAPAAVVRLAPSGDRAAYLRVVEPKGAVILTETALVSRREVHTLVGASASAPADIDRAVYAAELAAMSTGIQINDEVRAVRRQSIVDHVGV